MQTFAYKNKNVSGTKVAEYEPVSSLFKALANPVRAAIVHLLSNREHTVGQLVEELGQGVWYSICDQHVAHILGDAMKHTQEGKHDHDH